MHTNSASAARTTGEAKISVTSIRSLERGLRVLQAVNHRNGLKPSDIAELTGIPRPSVYRLLETLEEMELIARDNSTNNWRPALHCKSLSSGFRDEDWVCRIAVPKMIGLGRRILWPLDIVTLRNYKMEIRESTHSISPYSVNHGMVGRQIPILETAGGRTLLAFLPEDERNRILDVLGEMTGTARPFVLRDGSLDAILDRVREQGVGFRSHDFVDETQSISAPIWFDGQVFACLTIIWPSAAMRFDRAVSLYKDELLETAEAISCDLSSAAMQQAPLPVHAV